MNVKSALGRYEKAIVPSCCKNKCKLVTAGLNNVAVLDMDKGIQPNMVRSDCLVFHLTGKNLYIGICEMKSRHLDAYKIEQQLTASADFSLTICRICFPKIPYKVIPILLVKHYRSSAHTILTNIKIKMDGRKYHIRLYTCGSKFQHILNKEKPFANAPR